MGTIKLKDLLMEGAKEQATLDFLKQLIRKSPYEGKVFLAGGAVRDELMGIDANDLDFVINLEDGGAKFAEWATKKIGNYKKGSNPVTYETYGTAKFNLAGVEHKGFKLDDMDIDCVMPRTEEYEEGSRKPKVDSGSLKDDVDRRDFTTNSLLKNLSTGEILDLTGMGKQDIKDGIVRTPLDPNVIFSEDPLRMLRAVRFTMKYNWKLPLFMIKALKNNASKLKQISVERVQEELNKMLMTDSPDRAIKLLQITGLSKYVFPELDRLIKLEQNKYHKEDAMEHTLTVVKGTPKNLVTRLMALFHDIGKEATKEVIGKEIHFYGHEKIGAEMTEKILTRLKYPNKIIDAVVKGVASHMKLKHGGPDSFGATDKTLRKFKVNMGDHLEDVLNLIHADNIAHEAGFDMPNQIEAIRKRLDTLGIPQGKLKLPINGGDIMKKYKLKSGKIIGDLLAIVKDEYLENPKVNARQIYPKLEKYLEDHPQ
jgi:poly(A) polymerase